MTVTEARADATAPPPPDCVLVDGEPDAERVGDVWFARDVHALRAAPGLPAHLAQELDAWIRHMPDENVRSRRPFLVVEDRDGLTAYVFAPDPERQVPAWWRAALAAWRRTHARGPLGPAAPEAA